jgi:hypothetical protein
MDAAGQAGTGAGQAGAGAGGGAGAAGGGAAGNGAGGQPSVPIGAIVMGALADSTDAQNVLVVLDPATGAERAREPMIVAAVAYDGLVDRGYWYIFESKGFAEPTPSDEVVLHVRSLDLATAVWTEHAAVKVPPIVLGSAVVLNDRLAFLTYANASGSERQLVLLDTSLPTAAPSLSVSSEARWPTAQATGLVGVRSTTGIGGTLDVVGVTAAPCAADGDGGQCAVSLQPIGVSAGNPTVFAAKPAGKFTYVTGAQATWAAAQADNRVFVAFPALGLAKPLLQGFSPAGVSPLGAAVPFDATGPTLRSMAYDECGKLAFLSELNADQAVFAVPTQGLGASGIQSLGKPGQRVLYEATSRSLIVPFSQGGEHSLRAFRVDATTSPPKMTERVSSWAPPTDLAPGPMAFKLTVPIDCDTPLDDASRARLRGKLPQQLARDARLGWPRRGNVATGHGRRAPRLDPSSEKRSEPWPSKTWGRSAQLDARASPLPLLLLLLERPKRLVRSLPLAEPIHSRPCSRRSKPSKGAISAYASPSPKRLEKRRTASATP